MHARCEEQSRFLRRLIWANAQKPYQVISAFMWSAWDMGPAFASGMGPPGNAFG